MKISVNKTAFKRKDHVRVFTAEDTALGVLGDFEGVQIKNERGETLAELVYTPETPTKTGARAYLQVYNEDCVRLV